MNEADALDLIALVADKGSERFESCSDPKVPKGLNVISALYAPGQLKMWVGFQYGSGHSFLPACCGVYVEIDMKDWWSANKELRTA